MCVYIYVYILYPFYTISQLLAVFKLLSDPKKKYCNYEELKSNLVKCYSKPLRLQKGKHMEVYFPSLLTVVLSRPMVLSFHDISSVYSSRFSALIVIRVTEESRATITTARSYLAVASTDTATFQAAIDASRLPLTVPSFQ